MRLGVTRPYCGELMRFRRLEIDEPSATMGIMAWKPAEVRWPQGKRLFGFWRGRAAHLREGCGAVVIQPPD